MSVNILASDYVFISLTFISGLLFQDAIMQSLRPILMLNS